jgi:hypothetical protein
MEKVTKEEFINFCKRIALSNYNLSIQIARAGASQFGINVAKDVAGDQRSPFVAPAKKGNFVPIDFSRKSDKKKDHTLDSLTTKIVAAKQENPATETPIIDALFAEFGTQLLQKNTSQIVKLFGGHKSLLVELTAEGKTFKAKQPRPMDMVRAFKTIVKNRSKDDKDSTEVEAQ